jgi:hypothetical protein
MRVFWVIKLVVMKSISLLQADILMNHHALAQCIRFQEQSRNQASNSFFIQFNYLIADMGGSLGSALSDKSK